MSLISDQLDEISRRSAAKLLRRIPVTLKDVSRLSPTLVLGIGEVGHLVLEDLREYAREYSRFYRENYRASQGESPLLTTELIAEAMEQPLSVLSLPYLDGTTDVTWKTLSNEEVLQPHMTTPEITRELLDRDPALAGWVNPDLLEELRASANADLLTAAITARLRLYYSRAEVLQSLRAAFAKAVVLQPHLSHSGLTQGVEGPARMKVFLVAAFDDPAATLIPDLVAWTASLARESLRDVQVGVVLVDAGDAGDRANVRHRDGARHLAIAAANTITRGYEGFRGNCLSDSTVDALFPPVTPVGAVYVVGRALRGRELSASDCQRMATLLLFNCYYEKARLPIWSDRLQHGNGILSGFGTASIVFPWRYIKTFGLQFTLGGLYQKLEIVAPDRSEVPPPSTRLAGISAGDEDGDVDVERLVSAALQTCLVTPAHDSGRQAYLHSVLDEISTRRKAAEQKKSALEVQQGKLEDERAAVIRSYKKIGVIALAILPPLGGGLAALLANPANLLDYLELPALIAVGTGIGAALGGFVLYWCLSKLGPRAAERIDKQIAGVRVRLNQIASRVTGLGRAEARLASLEQSASRCRLLHSDLRSFGRSDLSLTVDERQVAATTLYLLVDQICTVPENTTGLQAYLGDARWIRDARTEAQRLYARLIDEGGGQRLLAALEKGDDEDLENLRAEFTTQLAKSLEPFVDNNTHLGEGVVARASNTLRGNSRMQNEWRQVLASWQRLSHPTIPAKGIDGSRVTRYAFTGEEPSEMEPAMADALHNARVVKGGDLRLLVRSEFVHGLEPADVAATFEHRVADGAESQLKWLDFAIDREKEPVEVRLACQLLVGIKERLAGAEVVKAEDMFALDLPAGSVVQAFSGNVEVERVYVDRGRPDVTPWATEVDELARLYAESGRRQPKTVGDHLRDIRFVALDPDLWSIMMTATEHPEFFAQSTEQQVDQLREFSEQMLRGAELRKDPGGAEWEWQSRWQSEGMNRLHTELPEIDVRSGAQTERTTTIAVQENGAWRLVAETLLDGYLRESANYLTIAKAVYVACVSGGRYGLTNGRTLTLAVNGSNYRLGYSFRELIQRIEKDGRLLGEIGALGRRWAREPRVQHAIEAAMRDVTREQKSWDQPFSSWL
jgi:hypothetical protein